MDALRAMVGKELRLRLRDRSVFLYGILAPIVLSVVLGGVFGGEDGITLDIELGVTSPGDEEAVVFAVEVSPMLEDVGVLSGSMVFGTVEELEAAVEDGSVDGGMVLGPSITVIGDAGTPSRNAVVEAVATSYAAERDGVRAVFAAANAYTSITGQALPVDDPGVLPAAGPVLTDHVVGVAPLDATTYLAAGMAVFFLLFATGIAVQGLLDEERDGTAARIRTAPVPPWALPLSKTITAVIVGFASLMVLVAATSVVVGASWGSPIGIAVIGLAAVLAAAGVMTLVASLVRTPEAAQSATGVVGTVLGALGGAFFPLRGGVLDVVSRATPHRWFLDGVQQVAGGAPLSDVTTELAVLLAMAVVTFGAAVVLLARRAEV